MLTEAGAEATAAALKELQIDACLANLNAPDQTVIAGRVEAIEAAGEQLTRRGLRTRRIPGSAAFHTEMLSPVSEALDKFLGGLTFAKPALPVYSNTTGELHAEEPEAIRRLLSPIASQRSPTASAHSAQAGRYGRGVAPGAIT